MNSSTKHSVIASVVSSLQASPTPFNSIGSSKSNSSFGIIFLLLKGRPATAAGAEFALEILLHGLVFTIGRHAVGARFPGAFTSQAAVFGFRDAHQAFFGDGIHGVVVGLAAEQVAHVGLGLVEERVGLV